MAAVRHLGFSKIWFLTNRWHWAAHLPSRYQIWCKNVDRRQSYGRKTKFKMAAAAILNLLPVAIFDIQLTFHFWAQPPHKIWCQYLNRRLTYGNFSKFKMTAVRHLGFGFSKIWFLTNRWPWAADFPSWYQIWCKKCWLTPKLWPKNEIQNGGRRHLEFTSGRYFWHTADFPLLSSTTTQNLVLIPQLAADLW